MAYEKRVCVLKQIKRGFSADGGTLTGAVYAERLGETLTVTSKMAGIAAVSAGSYVLAVWAGGEIFCLDFQPAVTVSPAPSLENGFAALLCFVHKEVEPVAYGYCLGAPKTYQTLLAAVTEIGKKKREPTKKPPVKEATEIAPATEQKKEGEYDDEAIAETDYYRIPEGGSDADSAVSAQEETGENKSGGNPVQDDNAIPPAPASRGTLAYYKEVEAKLKAAFEKYETDERLKGVFPQSEWVNAEGALLGVIYENGMPRYLCVASPKESAPEEMKEQGIFVPQTPFSDDEGFYIVFQDADTGEYVTVSDG